MNVSCSFPQNRSVHDAVHVESKHHELPAYDSKSLCIWCYLFVKMHFSYTAFPPLSLSLVGHDRFSGTPSVGGCCQACFSKSLEQPGSHIPVRKLSAGAASCCLWGQEPHAWATATLNVWALCEMLCCLVILCMTGLICTCCTGWWLCQRLYWQSFLQACLLEPLWAARQWMCSTKGSHSRNAWY